MESMDAVSLTHLPLVWPYPGSRFRGCRAHRTGVTRAVGGRTCPSGAGGCSVRRSRMSEGCSSCWTDHKRFKVLNTKR